MAPAMKIAPFFAALVAGFLFVSCSSTSQISLSYVPGPGHQRPGQAELTTRMFEDRRGEEATYIGTVRTQIGTPVERVHTRLPVDQVVTNAFGHALQARGMLTSPNAARFVITGEILDLSCLSLVRPSGYARIRVKVLDAGSGQILFNQVFESERTGAPYIPGSGSPVPLLRDLVSAALQDAVDRCLDEGGLRAILDSSGPRPGGASPRFVPGML